MLAADDVFSALGGKNLRVRQNALCPDRIIRLGFQTHRVEAILNF